MAESNQVQKKESDMFDMMSLYECKEFAMRIFAMAEENDGELTEEQSENLKAVVKQGDTKQLPQAAGAIKFFEHTITMLKTREKEIQARRKKLEALLERIKLLAAYWVRDVLGKKSYTVGQYKISTRESTSVEVDPDFQDRFYCEQVITYKPKKTEIKDAIGRGEEIEGARLVTKVSASVS